MKNIFKITLLILIIAQFSCKNEDDDIQIDTDGDGIYDTIEVDNGTDKNDPCDPQQEAGYTGYDATNTIWSNANCDADSVLNGAEIANGTDPYIDNTSYAIAELLPNLSELNLFKGLMSNIEPIETVHVFDLQTSLYTDYAKKIRFISIPKGESMVYNGADFPIYPNNTILTKTFYYLNDERDESLGKKIIETRVLIKKAGIWEIGNYIWNEEQTDAVRDESGTTLPITWVNNEGIERSFTYEVPDYAACVKCHQNNGTRVPIGPKIRNMNVENQLQHYIDLGLLTNAPAVSEIIKLPNWEDDTYSLEERGRAYLDVNCAHCHQAGGFFNVNFFDSFDLRFELLFDDTNIDNVKDNINIRMSLDPSNEYVMPQIGTVIRHEEGYALMLEYVNSL